MLQDALWDSLDRKGAYIVTDDGRYRDAFTWRWVFNTRGDSAAVKEKLPCLTCGKPIMYPYHCFTSPNAYIAMNKHLHIHDACFPPDLRVALALDGKQPSNG